jgi:hypothetical protein
MTVTINDTQHSNALPLCCVSLWRVSRLFTVMLNVIMMSVVMLSVVMPSVDMLSVVAPDRVKTQGSDGYFLSIVI